MGRVKKRAWSGVLGLESSGGFVLLGIGNGLGFLLAFLIYSTLMGFRGLLRHDGYEDRGKD